MRLIDLLVYIFKQKTAYDMGISDWSSDVCSSDLPLSQGRREKWPTFSTFIFPPHSVDNNVNAMTAAARPHDHDITVGPDAIDFMGHVHNAHHLSWVQEAVLARSEEHTSELPSLMRNSYAVFCLKKKNSKTTT